MWFATPVAVDLDRFRLEADDDGLARGAVGLPDYIPYWMEVAALGMTDEVAITGVALSAHPDGRLADEFL